MCFHHNHMALPLHDPYFAPQNPPINKIEKEKKEDTRRISGGHLRRWNGCINHAIVSFPSLVSAAFLIFK
ncbi:hypothetical protein Hanom_Chr01g00065561 [Helianthus anomalus]